MLTCPIIIAFLYFLIQVYFYVTIMKGVVPVSGMNVTASVTGPSGVSVRIKLLDNGAGKCKYHIWDACEVIRLA